MEFVSNVDDAKPASGPAGEVPLSQSEWQRVVREANQTRADFPAHLCIHELFEEQVVRSPEETAVVCAGEEMTYRQLNQRANQLACLLRQKNIGPNKLVGIYTDRSVEFVVSVLAVLKAGGAYVPLDIEYPAERLRLIIADANPDAFVCGFKGEIVPTLEQDRVIHLKPSDAALEESSDDNLPRTASPGDLAYVMFTSGSTGRPKGVCMPHRPLVNLIHWQKRHSPAGPGHRTLQYAPLGFDVCFQEIFATLTTGGCLVVASRKERKDFVGLVQLIEQAGINRIFLPFVALEFLAEVIADGNRTPVSLRELITAGEQLRITPAIRALFARLPDARLINQYGPTEAHVVSAFELSGDPARWPYLPSIGKPVANTELYVLDADRNPVVPGQTGELYIGGVQVARGYLNRPEMTAEKFVPDPFTVTPGRCLYRTGDLARHMPDGNLEFLGRTDDQVKIRGFRVELGEIESVLAGHPDVQRAVVLVREDEPGEKCLTAYVMIRDGIAERVRQLREYLSVRLPDYMVPAVFIPVKTFPLTPNGKIDRKALPVPNPEDFKSHVDYVAPRTPQEQMLATIWQEILGVSKVGLNDNFFLMGGDSLSAVKLMLRVEKATGQWLELSTFLLKPTLAGLSEALDARRANAGFQPEVMIRQGGNRPPLFCLYNITGDVDIYFSLAQALGKEQPVVGIRSTVIGGQGELPVSIEAAAADVVRRIRKIQPEGIPALVGYSWAGLLAFEVARQFQAQEGINCFAALIGPDTPMRTTTPLTRSIHFVRHFPGWLWRAFAERENRLRRFSRWREMARATRETVNGDNLSIPGWADTPVSRHLMGLVKQYRPPSKANLSLDIFRERDEQSHKAHPLKPWESGHFYDGGWSLWTQRPVRVHWIAGDHWTVISPPAVNELATAIGKAYDEFLQSTFADGSSHRMRLSLPAFVGCCCEQLGELVNF